MIFPLNPTTAEFVAFAASSVQSVVPLLPTNRYAVVTDTAVMVAQGANPTAAKSNGSTLLVPGGIPLLLDGRNGAKVAAIQAGATGGQLTITKVED